jgi:hypothetical protein
LAQAVVLLLLLLGGGLTFAFAFGWLSGSGSKGRSPSRQSRSRQGAARQRRRDGARGDDPRLPPSSASLFPLSHHEKIHDPKYLQRMLEAEEQRRRSAPRTQADSPQNLSQPKPRRTRPKADPSSSPDSPT